MLHRPTSFVGALLLAGLLAACANGGASPSAVAPSVAAVGGSGTSITITSHEFGFSPNDIAAPADTDIAVSLVNDGSVEHDWTIVDQGVTVTATPGQTGTGSFNLPTGTYTIICSVPGHETAGMKGTLTVG